MVQGQVEAYKIDHNGYPTDFSKLVDDGYFSETPQCPDGRALTLVNGKVNYIGE